MWDTFGYSILENKGVGKGWGLLKHGAFLCTCMRTAFSLFMRFEVPQTNAVFWVQDPPPPPPKKEL